MVVSVYARSPPYMYVISSPSLFCCPIPSSFIPGTLRAYQALTLISDTYLRISIQVYQALLVGTIPIYIGAPNVDSLLPCERCIIKTNDFNSPAALGQHLHYLISHPAEYHKLLAWKLNGLDFFRFPGFKKVVDLSIDTAHCRLCARLRPGECQDCGSVCHEEQVKQYDAKKNGTIAWSPSHERVTN